MENGQLIIIADPIRNRAPHAETDTKGWLESEIKNRNVIYTSLLPGPETEAAEIALRLKVPYIVPVPYKYRYTKWPRKTQNQYLRLLKKAVKVVYVDREPGHISDTYPPDVGGMGKVTQQIFWLIQKIRLFSGVTHIITYTSGFYSERSRTLQATLNLPGSTEKWHLTQRTHLQIIDPLDDDLPF